MSNVIEISALKMLQCSGQGGTMHRMGNKGQLLYNNLNILEQLVGLTQFLVRNILQSLYNKNLCNKF